jgi:hypothetical protein
VTADNPAINNYWHVIGAEERKFQYPAGSTVPIAPGDFLASARASLEELATRGVKVFFQATRQGEKFGGSAAQ